MTKPKRVRLSLETHTNVKDDLVAHAAELGERTLIGGIRAMLRRSKAIREAELRGTLLVETPDAVEEVKL